jgi:hypothetical protein
MSIAKSYIKILQIVTQNDFYVFAEVVYGIASTDECANLVCFANLFAAADACLGSTTAISVELYSLILFNSHQGFLSSEVC